MKYRAALSGSVLATVAMLASVNSSSAWPQFADLHAADQNSIVPVQMGGMGGGGMGGGGMGGGGMAGGMAGAGAKGGMATASGGMAGAKGGAKGGMAATTSGGMAGAKGGAKGTAGGMGSGGMGGNTNVNVNRNVNVNVHGTSVRPWVQRPYFGTVVGGVALGSVIAATAIPVAPAPNLCWIWTTSAQTQGYWDYCEPPQ